MYQYSPKLQQKTKTISNYLYGERKQATIEASSVGSGSTLSDSKFAGFQLDVSGKEAELFNVEIDGLILNISRKFEGSKDIQTCTIDDEGVETCKIETIEQPSMLLFKSGNDLTIPKEDRIINISLSEDSFIFQLDPTVRFYKFGNESITLSGTTTYPFNSSANVTIEDNSNTRGSAFAHLNLSTSAPYDRLKIYYTFDDGNGSMAKDYVSNNFSLDGLYFGGAINVSTQDIGMGQVLTLDGSNDRVAQSSSVPIQSTNVSVSMWGFLNADGVDDDMYFDFNGGYRFYFDPRTSNCAGTDDYSVGLQGGAGFNAACFTKPTNKTWHHFVAIYQSAQAAANETNLYIDGVLQTIQSKNSNAENTADIATTVIGNIGSANGGASLFVNGSVDEFMIFNTTLTGTQVLDIYNNRSRRFESSGELRFENISLGINNTVNLSIIRTGTILGSNVSANFFHGNKVGNFTNFTNSVLNNYDLSFIDLANRTNLNMTIRFNSDNNSFYSPLIVGNITLDAFVLSVVVNNLTNNTEFPADPATYVNGARYMFNVSVNSTNPIARVVLEFNKVNFTASNISQTQFNVSIFDLPANTTGFTYTWYANDTSGLNLGTILDTYTINKAVLSGAINITPATTVTYPTTTNASIIEGNLGDGDIVYNLTRDAVSILNPDVQTLQVGTFTYALNGASPAFAGASGQNYSSNSSINTTILTVNQGTGDVRTFINGSQADKTINIGSTIELNGSLFSSTLGAKFNLNLTRNETQLQFNTTNNISIQQAFDTFGDFRINTSYVGNANFTSDNEGFIVRVRDLLKPSVFLQSPPNFTTVTTNLTFFFANFTDNVNLVNATLEIYNASGLIGTNFTSVNGTLNSSNLSFTLPRSDTYLWNYKVTDNSTNVNYNNSNFTLVFSAGDTSFPLIQFISPTPANNTFFNNSHGFLDVNVSATDNALDTINIQIFDASGLYRDEYSQTSPFHILFGGASVFENVFFFNASANDTSGNINRTEVRTVTFDFTVPIINFTFPTPSTATITNNSIFSINVTAEDNNIGIPPALQSIHIKVFNSSGIQLNNISNSSPFNVTYSLPDGLYFFNATANDSAGNLVVTETRNITIDQLPPSVTNLLEFPTDPATYVSGARYIFNVTVTDVSPIGTVILEFNRKNFTASNISKTQFNVSIFDLNANTTGFEYRWYVNDTFGKRNDTEGGNYTIKRAVGVVNTLIDGARSNEAINFGTLNTNITIFLINGTGNLNLTINGTQFNFGASPLQNLSNFSIGIFTINGSSFQSQNFTQESETFILTVNPPPGAISTVCNNAHTISRQLEARPFGRLCFAIFSNRPFGVLGESII